MSNAKQAKGQRRPSRNQNSQTNAKTGQSGGGGNNSNSNGNQGNNPSNNQSNNKSNSQARSNSRRRKGSRKKKVDPRVFWGDPEQLAGLGAERALISTRPSAVVQSLGRPPLSGQQNAAEHYFAAVYDRAVNLAAALAAAGELVEPDELTS